MSKIIIDGVPINIIGMAKSGRSWVMYAVDAEVNHEDFDAFLELHKKYNSYGNYFNAIIIEGQNFHGRFGQLIYSKSESCYKIRVYFVESEGDEDKYFAGWVSYDDVLYNNMSKMLAKQELTINRLIHALVENKLLNEIDSKKLISHRDEDIDALRIKMSRQVDDLDRYLSDTHNTLSDIEKEE